MRNTMYRVSRKIYFEQISGNDLNVDVQKAIEMFEGNANTAPASFHKTAIPLCYNEVFAPADVNKLNKLDETLPLLYYNFFSCHEKKIEDICETKHIRKWQTNSSFRKYSLYLQRYIC